MAKQSHIVRVWARHDGRRTLEFRLDAPNARGLALDRVHALEMDPAVAEIEMREHTVEDDDLDQPVVMHRTLQWVRTGERWRRLPDRNVHVQPMHRPATPGR